MNNYKQLEIPFSEENFQIPKPLITKVCETKEEILIELLNWNLSNLDQTDFIKEDLQHLWKYVRLKKKKNSKKL